jgi:hypothetical protein
MKRRTFAGGIAGAAGISALTVNNLQGQTSLPTIIELRWLRLRNTTDNQRVRCAEYLSKTVVPALQKHGAKSTGLFSSSIAPDSPFMLVLSEFASLPAWEETQSRLNGDRDLMAAMEKALSGPLLYQRMEVQLLRSFRGFPAVEVPKPGERPRLFELRTYESNNGLTLRRKIGMFENGEIDIFRKYGLLPVFFGETIAGVKMPNLTYMVAFDNLAAREANWRAFAQSPEWKQLSAKPGLSDGEIVSNITSMLLSPAAGSQIR